MSLHVQFFTLFTMFASGLGLGGLFDLYRVLSWQLRIARWVKSVLDIIYWVVATILVFQVLYYSNQGQIRLFVFLGILIGITFYFALISTYMIKFILWIIRLIKRWVQIAIWLFEMLVITPILVLYKIVIIFAGFLLAISIFLYKFVIQLCYPLWMLINFLIKPLTRRFKLPRWGVNIKDKIIKAFKRLF